jgi:acetyl esterase/lipase
VLGDKPHAEVTGLGAFLRPSDCDTTTSHNLGRLTNQPGKERVTVGAHRLRPRFFDDLYAHNPVSDCVDNPRPTLLVQGSDDQAVPPSVSQAYVDALERADVPYTHHVMQGADHGFSKPAWREELITTLSKWFVDGLAHG